MDETQNDAPFVTFYDMHAVAFVPPDEMADVTIAVFTSRKKYRIWNKNYPACCNPTNYEESSRSSLI